MTHPAAAARAVAAAVEASAGAGAAVPAAGVTAGAGEASAGGGEAVAGAGEAVAGTGEAWAAAGDAVAVVAEVVAGADEAVTGAGEAIAGGGATVAATEEAGIERTRYHPLRVISSFTGRFAGEQTGRGRKLVVVRGFPPVERRSRPARVRPPRRLRNASRAALHHPRPPIPGIETAPRAGRPPGADLLVPTSR